CPVPVPMRATNDARSSLSSHYLSFYWPRPVRMFELTVDLHSLTHRRQCPSASPWARSFASSQGHHHPSVARWPCFICARQLISQHRSHVHSGGHQFCPENLTARCPSVRECIY